MEGTFENWGPGGLTRRMFVSAGIGVGALVLTPHAWAKTGAATRRGPLVRAHFKPLVGEKLRMTGENTDVQVELAGISDLVPVLRHDDPNRFALMFKVPLEHTGTGGIMTFHHRHFGQVELFVSPVDRAIKVRHYEAVINRSRS